MSPTERVYSNSKETILDAAHRVAERDGAGKVTIDAVAREAGVSKGGVLYNFPSKEMLLKGMLERKIETSRADMNALREDLKRKGEKNPTLRAMIRSACLKECETDNGVSMAILASAAQNPDLLEPARVLFRQYWADIMTECDDIAGAAVLFAAIDGLVLTSKLGMGMAPYNTDDLDSFIEKFDQFAKGL
ncbi:TetR/AcrR family transcriptional regulator [Kordiimonas pumila]|uniref:TetR/AcrR family transcriptional regulator n=1 Tax=Kordiimonas pumila TaxID=2161677 RepID=A0ABV7D345_9PROT|nr:TetR/AcrR family transcriptional regulator [Kordiimonas pumila]